VLRPTQIRKAACTSSLGFKRKFTPCLGVFALTFSDVFISRTFSKGLALGHVNIMFQEKVLQFYFRVQYQGLVQDLFRSWYRFQLFFLVISQDPDIRILIF